MCGLDRGRNLVLQQQKPRENDQSYLVSRGGRGLEEVEDSDKAASSIVSSTRKKSRNDFSLFNKEGNVT